LLDKIKELGIEETAKIATVVGRYYAMDRDKRYSFAAPVAGEVQADD
jgi:bisphosphoglycerate-independent phosphoglycerate mutase (AlkP superfamily)